MRVAVLYDIHGNLPALEAVLEAIETEGIDRIVVGGDIVPGPMPRESVSALLDLTVPVQFIQGNGERDVLALHRGEEPTRVPERLRGLLRWVADQIPAEQLSELSRWPLTLRVDIPGLGDVLFCHATPRDDNELFTRLTPEHRLRPIFESTGAALVVCGHTHMQFDRTIGDVRVVNAGSVGMPFAEPGAYWLLLGPGVELRRTRYDFAAATERIRAVDYPGLPDFDVTRPPREDQMIEAFESAAIG